jgi:hypothetical protein
VVVGLERIGPELQVSEFHTDDEQVKTGTGGLTVTEDAQEDGFFKKSRSTRSSRTVC